MTSVTLLSHFFNEEYLLPWWVEHHLPLFDEAILIDYGSTDSSVAVIRDLAPHWRVVQSRNAAFDAALVDAEVMEYERSLKGWKIALTTTEFLLGDPRVTVSNVNTPGLRIPSCTMVDLQPAEEPAPALPLIEQKPWGIDEGTWTHHSPNRSRLTLGGLRGWSAARLAGVDPSLCAVYSPHMRARLIHNSHFAGYTPGRHSWSLSDSPTTDGLQIMWYGLSPWTPKSLARKAQIRTRVPDSDLEQGFGVHHYWNMEDLQALRRYWAKYAKSCRRPPT